jgi:ubiquinone biosynthesis protein UbiJ
MPATPAWLAPLEGAINRNIGAQVHATALARRLEGKSLLLDVTGLLQVRIVAVHGRLLLLAGDGTPADAAISGGNAALLGMMTGAAAGAPAGGGVQVQGDAEVAALYRELLQLARPDPEEEAARVLGDVPARRLGNLARSAGRWLQGVGRSTGANIAEYLTEESRDLVSRTELDEFLRGVDDAREAADRLEARLRRLERPAAGGSS